MKSQLCDMVTLQSVIINKIVLGVLDYSLECFSHFLCL